MQFQWITSKTQLVIEFDNFLILANWSVSAVVFMVVNRTSFESIDTNILFYDGLNIFDNLQSKYDSEHTIEPLVFLAVKVYGCVGDPSRAEGSIVVYEVRAVRHLARDSRAPSENSISQLRSLHLFRYVTNDTNIQYTSTTLLLT